MESTQPALELASKHMTKLKSVNIICEIHFTHVFIKYSLRPKKKWLQVFDTKKFILFCRNLSEICFKKFSLTTKKIIMCIYKNKTSNKIFFCCEKIV